MRRVKEDESVPVIGEERRSNAGDICHVKVLGRQREQESVPERG